VPSFVIALYSMLVFAVWLRWLPAIGAGEAGDFWSQMRAVILPAFAIGITWVGYLARLVRASMLEVMSANHIRTARAFGLPEWKIVTRYALRIAIIPTIAIIAVGFGSILSSAVFVETVFSRPGVGSLITIAVQKRNYPVVMGTVLFMTAFYLVVVTAADLLMAKLDPRVRDAFRR
jgi:ABC-type dipeptide/oligopeptide/nickel transport system permease component